MGFAFDPIGFLLSLVILLVIIAMLGWLFFARSRRAPRNPIDSATEGHESILVAVTDSIVSTRAVELACRLAADKQAKIILANVVEVPLRFTLDAALPQLEDKARGMLNVVAQSVKERGFEAESRVVRDRTTIGGLVDLARDAHASMIVVGFDGSLQSGLNDLITISALFRHSPCEVLVAREPLPAQDGFRMGRLIEPSIRAS